MLDILGFRRMVQTRRLRELTRDVERLFNAAKPAEAEFHFHMADGGLGTESLTLGRLHFSDTIMLWTPRFNPANPDLNAEMFSHICRSVSNLIALALINGIPLRGGLAGGECYIDPVKQIVVGQPIVDAYLLEREQEWLGAAISMQRVRAPSGFGGFGEPLVQYAVPTKTPVPPDQLLAVDWTGIARMPEAMTRQLWKINARIETERALAEGAKLSEATDFHQKWKNATDFYTVQLQRQADRWMAIRPKAKGSGKAAPQPRTKR